MPVTVSGIWWVLSICCLNEYLAGGEAVKGGGWRGVKILVDCAEEHGVTLNALGRKGD